MVQINLQLPEWLQTWLKLSFYEEGEKCSTHHKQYNTNYCVVCMKGPVCDSCLQEFSKQHKDHHCQILRVQVASRRAGIRVKDIEKILDVSKIEVYSINNGSIVYLNSKSKEGAIHQIKPNSCRSCHRSTQLKPGYEFCSIACKAKVKGRDMVIEKKKFERKTESESRPSDIDFVAAAAADERLPSPPPPPISTALDSTSTNENIKRKADVDNKKNIDSHHGQCSPSPTPVVSCRKKSRKGIPHRAPFK